MNLLLFWNISARRFLRACHFLNIPLIPYCVCVKRITFCNCLCSSPWRYSSHVSASCIRNFRIVNRYSWFKKYRNMADRDCEFSFLKRYPFKNWYKNYQAGANDVITSRSCDKLKTWYLHYLRAYGHQIW